MLKLMLACCKVYISESRNKVALQSIERAAAKFSQEAPIINKFEDEIYNRVGYTLVSRMGPRNNPEPLVESDPPKPTTAAAVLKTAVFEMVKAAYETIDLEEHSGSHPRLGVVDHICFHPLEGASLENVAQVAKSLAADVGSHLEVPTFLYGAAHPEGRSLASIRRELGYFKPNVSGNEWAGGPKSGSSQLVPDEGPVEGFLGKGFLTIGATRWVDNYNVPVYSDDIAAVSRIAKRISSRGGGLPSVQSMALVHGEGVIEVACNLLEPSTIGGSRVQLEIERLAEEEGMTIGEGYYTDFSQEKIIETFMKLGL